MAKPTGWSIYSAAQPRIEKQYQDSFRVSAQCSRRRWRPFSRVPGPSSGVLSLLATIAAASSTADGSPLIIPFTPPSFLCPFIERDGCHSNVDTPPNFNFVKRASDSLPPPRNQRRAVQIADKFEQGPDGKWRKADAYTLYGSTVCSNNCPPASTPAGANNAINPTTPTTSPSPSTVPQPGDKYAAAMPTGWSTSPNYDRPRTTLILCVSLILAFFMCAFMTAFVIWRRKHPKSPAGDEEMKLRRRRGQDLSEQETLMKKEARLKQKFWARASARWKANAQSSARRRKNRRLLAAVQSMSALLHENSRPESIRRNHSRPSSSTPTPRSSLSSEQRTTHVDGHTTLGPSISTPTTDPVAPSPPAYIQRDSPSSMQSKRGHADNTYIRTDHDPPDPFSLVPRDTEGHPQYTPSTDEVPIHSYHAGHVATDDKTLLARMATMASAPPVEPDEEGGSSTLPISAPVWDDEQLLEDIIDGLDDEMGEPSSRTSSPPPLPSITTTPHPLFPAPPSKGKMAAPDFYDYPYSFEEDVSTLEPEIGPSAPPFEEHTPSAPPPLEELEVEPSAPPLMEEFLPSAPGWENSEGGQDHDREENLRPLSPASISATGDNILPSYHA